ncbi:MAG: MBL fold metallo-hydrolase [Bryobacteraceae bacterium]
MSARYHSIRLPFHLELDHVWVHVLETPHGWALVDTGFATDASFAALESGLRNVGLGWGDIDTLFLTHTHPDHMSLANRVVERTGARVLLHRREEKLLAELRARPAEDANLERWGTPPELASRIGAAMQDSAWMFLPLRSAEPVDEGYRLGSWRVVETPGHAPGHLCLYHEQARTLIAGDHVLEKITPHVSWWPSGDSLTAFLGSLEHVSKLAVDKVIPSHGDPFTGLARRAAEIREHHFERIEKIRQAQANGARTPHEIVGKLWTRKLSPFQYRFAIYEVMAHIETSAANASTRLK